MFLSVGVSGWILDMTDSKFKLWKKVRKKNGDIDGTRDREENGSTEVKAKKIRG